VAAGARAHGQRHQIETFNETVPVLTRDENIVNVEINVQYRIGDAQAYLFGTRNADDVLKQAALSTVREQVGRADLDTVLGARNALAVTARDQLQKSLATYGTGLNVTELNLPNARPPEEVKPAFDDVNSAQQDKDRVTSEAIAYAAKVVPVARGEAARTRTVSEGYKTAAIARATGDATRFSLLVEQYKAAPDVTRKRLWLDTVQTGAGRESHCSWWRRPPADLRADARRQGPGRRDHGAARDIGAGTDFADGGSHRGARAERA
jgi:membrane protease subunit HflK